MTMATEADYDDWADETPEPPDRLTELATQLAEYAGLTVGPPIRPETPAQSVLVQFRCGLCNGVILHHLLLTSALTHELSDVHVCMSGASAAGQPSVFPFAIAVRSAA